MSHKPKNSSAKKNTVTPQNKTKICNTQVLTPLDLSKKKLSGADNQLKIILALIVAVLGFALYANTLHHSYTLDDFSVIKENRVVKQGLAGIPTILKTSYRYGYWSHADELYRPLPLVMYAIEWHFFPDRAPVYHLFNVLFYALSGALLFLTLQRILSKFNLLLPFLISILFIAHPIHSEVVASIKSRDEIMGFFFAIGSMYLLSGSLSKKSFLPGFLSLLLYFLSLLSKESGITLLAVIPLLLYFFTDALPKKIIVHSSLYFIPATLYLVIRSQILSGLTGSGGIAMIDNVMAGASYPDRFATAMMVMGKYLGVLLFPHPLACDYSFNALHVITPGHPGALFSLLIHLSLAVYAVVNLKKKHLIVFGILFYFITISLVSNVVLLIGSSMAERFLYLPTLGFSIAVSGIMLKIFSIKFQHVPPASLWHFISANKKILLLLVPLLAVYAGKTIARNRDWKNNYTLYANDVKVNPESARLHYYYGNTLIKEMYTEEKDAGKKTSYLEEGIRELEEALRIFPAYSDPYVQLGVAYYRKGNNQKAIEYSKKALEYNPADAVSWNNMGGAYFTMGKFEEAITLYRKALHFDTRYVDAFVNMGSTLGMMKRYDEAITHFNKALELDPQNMSAINFLAITYRFKGDTISAKRYSNMLR